MSNKKADLTDLSRQYGGRPYEKYYKDTSDSKDDKEE